MTDVSIPPNTATVKRCAKCGFECAIEDAAQFFYCTLRRGKPCFASYCKPCQRAYQVARRKQNPERVREIARRSYWNNHDERREKLRLYRLKNIDRDKRRLKKWRQNNQDKERAIHKRYYEKNKDKFYMQKMQRKARVLHTEFRWNREDQLAAAEHFYHACAYCGSQTRDLFGAVTLHFDHYIPLVMGGPTTPDNMLPTCSDCNKSKWSKPPEEWVTKRFGKRKGRVILERISAYFEQVKMRESGK